MSLDPIKTCSQPGTLKVWTCIYSVTGSWGYYQDYYAVVVAETKQAALGWLLQSYPDAYAERWSIEELDTTVAGVTRITERSS
jgi:hypothetical protein